MPWLANVPVSRVALGQSRWYAMQLAAHALIGVGRCMLAGALALLQKLLPPPVNRLARVDAVPVCKRCCAEGICPRSG